VPIVADQNGFNVAALHHLENFAEREQKMATLYNRIAMLEEMVIELQSGKNHTV
jgi:hypothetical protein